MRRAGFGTWSLGLLWSLVFGIWDFRQLCINQPIIIMKLTLALLFAGCLVVCPETEERINKRFAVRPGGKLVVDVDFGSIDVNTNATGEVVVDVVRKVSRRNKSEEEAFLRERPVTFSEDG